MSVGCHCAGSQDCESGGQREAGRFRQMASEADRDPLPVTIGGVAEDIAQLHRFRDLGSTRVNVSLPPESRDQILPILDRWQKLIRQFRAT